MKVDNWSSTKKIQQKENSTENFTEKKTLKKTRNLMNFEAFR